MDRVAHDALITWYVSYGRHNLPWRTTDDPYAIYLSEVMLQQTQVATVLARYYQPFLNTFPTISALAAAPLEKVLKQWEGMGYYRRARHLHRSAQIIMQRHDGRLPKDIDALMALPGIGRNTAHAIAAFAFGAAVPVMEANVRRVLARIHALTSPTPAQLWRIAHDALDAARSFDYNQAMMDLGAMVCTPNTPRCSACPLHTVCLGRDDPARYGIALKRRAPAKHALILLRRSGDKLAMKRREGEFLHGLWGFEATETIPAHARDLGQVRHAYTHFKLTCRIYLVDETARDHTDYFAPDEIAALPISKVDAKILARYLDACNLE